MWRNIVAKQKPYGENTLAIYNVFFIKKKYKAKFSTSST
jgi:hypothetical protein